jgi:hypothetical protein
MRDSCRSSVLTRSEGDRVRVHTVLIRLAPLRDHAVAIRASGRVHSLGWRSASQGLGLASCRTMRQGLVLSSERGFLAGWWRCVYSPNFGAFAKVCESRRRLASGLKRIGRQRAYDVSSACWMILRSNLVGEAGHYLNRPGELRGGVLELIRAHRDRLEQCVLIGAPRSEIPSRVR